MRRNVGVPKQSKKRAQLEIDRIAINMYEIFADSAARGRLGGFERKGCSASEGWGPKKSVESSLPLKDEPRWRRRPWNRNWPGIRERMDSTGLSGVVPVHGGWK